MIDSFMENSPLRVLIPKGLYCYSYTGRIMINNKFIGHDGEVYSGGFYYRPEIKPCPFWKGGLGEQGKDAYCVYMREHSEYQDIGSLIWDQVKECGENDDIDHMEFDDESNREILSVESVVNSRIKKTPHFIENMAISLSETDNNAITYDGVTYTLAPNLYKELVLNR